MKIPGLHALARDRFFHLLFIIGAVLSIFVPFAPHTWPAVIDWRTIITLSGLMMLTKGVELTGYFDVRGGKMVRRVATERRLYLADGPAGTGDDAVATGGMLVCFSG